MLQGMDAPIVHARRSTTTSSRKQRDIFESSTSRTSSSTSSSRSRLKELYLTALHTRGGHGVLKMVEEVRLEDEANAKASKEAAVSQKDKQVEQDASTTAAVVQSGTPSRTGVDVEGRKNKAKSSTTRSSRPVWVLEVERNLRRAFEKRRHMADKSRDDQSDPSTPIAPQIIPLSTYHDCQGQTNCYFRNLCVAPSGRFFVYAKSKNAVYHDAIHQTIAFRPEGWAMPYIQMDFKRFRKTPKPFRFLFSNPFKPVHPYWPESRILETKGLVIGNQEFNSFGGWMPAVNGWTDEETRLAEELERRRASRGEDDAHEDGEPSTSSASAISKPEEGDGDTASTSKATSSSRRSRSVLALPFVDMQIVDNGLPYPLLLAPSASEHQPEVNVLLSSSSEYSVMGTLDSMWQVFCSLARWGFLGVDYHRLEDLIGEQEEAVGHDEGAVKNSREQETVEDKNVLYSTVAAAKAKEQASLSVENLLRSSSDNIRRSTNLKKNNIKIKSRPQEHPIVNLYMMNSPKDGMPPAATNSSNVSTMAFSPSLFKFNSSRTRTKEATINPSTSSSSPSDNFLLSTVASTVNPFERMPRGRCLPHLIAGWKHLQWRDPDLTWKYEYNLLLKHKAGVGVDPSMLVSFRNYVYERLGLLSPASRVEDFSSSTTSNGDIDEDIRVRREYSGGEGDIEDDRVNREYSGRDEPGTRIRMDSRSFIDLALRRKGKLEIERDQKYGKIVNIRRIDKKKPKILIFRRHSRPQDLEEAGSFKPRGSSSSGTAESGSSQPDGRRRGRLDSAITGGNLANAEDIAEYLQNRFRQKSTTSKGEDPFDIEIIDPIGEKHEDEDDEQQLPSPSLLDIVLKSIEGDIFIGYDEDASANFLFSPEHAALIAPWRTRFDRTARIFDIDRVFRQIPHRMVVHYGVGVHGRVGLPLETVGSSSAGGEHRSKKSNAAHETYQNMNNLFQGGVLAGIDRVNPAPVGGPGDRAMQEKKTVTVTTSSSTKGLSREHVAGEVQLVAEHQLNESSKRKGRRKTQIILYPNRKELGGLKGVILGQTYTHNSTDYVLHPDDYVVSADKSKTSASSGTPRVQRPVAIKHADFILSGLSEIGDYVAEALDYLTVNGVKFASKPGFKREHREPRGTQPMRNRQFVKRKVTEQMLLMRRIFGDEDFAHLVDAVLTRKEEETGIDLSSFLEKWKMDKHAAGLGTPTH
ncbi:unnamed protein product [Amoebophrya sp. A25]|nr:unnamed protein product [Amoebophrya sp. A25]|eukprot:GSA25T00001433001.1